MKSAVLATVLTGAAAFAPSSRSTSSSALKMSYENELGVIAPTQFFGKFRWTSSVQHKQIKV
jgi:hypothetical protein